MNQTKFQYLMNRFERIDRLRELALKDGNFLKVKQATFLLMAVAKKLNFLLTINYN